MVRYSVNIPYSDDFPSILSRFVDLAQKHTLWEKFLHFFAFNNEHRVVWNHIVQYLYYQIAGVINFKHLLYIGNLSLIAILVFFWKTIQSKNKLFVFALVVLLLINLRFGETTFSTMTALSNLWVVAFSLAAIYFSMKKGYKPFLVVLLFALLAFGCQGNGMIIFPTLIITYLFHGQKRYALIVAFIAILCIGLHFIGYHEPAGLPSKIQNIIMFVTNPKYRLYPFVFLGNIVGMPSYYFTSFFASHNLPRFLVAVPSLLLGLSSFAYVLYIFIRKRFYASNILLSAVILYIFLNAGMAGFARLNGGFDTMMECRYSFYSLMRICCVLISFYEIRGDKIKRIKMVNSILFITLIIMNIGFTFFVYNFRLKVNIQQRIESMRNYRQSGEYIGVVHPDIIIEQRVLELGVTNINKDNVKQQVEIGNLRYTDILNRAVEEGYYALPK